MANAKPDALRLILHVGAGKCGSSALQSALSRRPVIDQGTGYAVIAANSQVVPPWRLAGLPSLTGYHASVGARAFEALDLPTVVRDLRALGGTIVLSNEGWWTAPKVVARLVRRVGTPARAIFYVRPQPEYVNSAWWQWGAWGSVPPADYLVHAARRAHWADAVQRWAQICPDVPLEVRPLPDDIVTDFQTGVLGQATGTPAAGRSNRALPAPVLRLYQRNRVLRPGPHDGDMDFTLAARLTFPAAPRG